MTAPGIGAAQKSKDWRPTKKFVWPLMLLALVGALVIGSWPDGSSSPSHENRAKALAQQVRCPTCAGLSAAESESPLAQSTREEIDRRVASGETDAQIKDYFVSRYGPSALMTPEKSGITSIIWTAPVTLGIVAFIGVGLVVRRWRTTKPTSTSTPTAEPSLDVVIHHAMAGELRHHENESPAKGKSSRNRGRVVVLVGGFVAVSAAVLISGLGERLVGDQITGGADQSPSALLKRAQQYTSKGNGVEAVKTYDQVLKKDPNNYEALAYRGWLVRLAGLPNEGLKSIDKATQINPTYADAHFFKGFILLRDNNDPKGAIVEFQAFLDNDPPQQMVSMVEQAMQEAKALAAAG